MPSIAPVKMCRTCLHRPNAGGQQDTRNVAYARTTFRLHLISPVVATAGAWPMACLQYANIWPTIPQNCAHTWPAKCQHIANTWTAVCQHLTRTPVYVTVYMRGNIIKPKILIIGDLITLQSQMITYRGRDDTVLYFHRFEIICKFLVFLTR
jgi:hypothetical protein